VSDFEGRGQVENELGRALSPEELTISKSIDDLSPASLTVLRVLARRQRLAALLYLRVVLPDASTPLLDELINRHS